MKCHKCGYEWKTKSKHVYVTCPSCLAKVKVEQFSQNVTKGEK